MRKFYPLYLILLLTLSACNKKNEVNISGSFQFPVTTKMAFYEVQQENVKLIDSLLLEETTDFNFKHTIAYGNIYMLKFFDAEKIYLVAHPGDNIALKIENNQTLEYFVEGSNDSKLLRNLMFEQKKVKHAISNLSSEYDQAYLQDFKTHSKAYFDSIYNLLIEKHKDFSTQFIKANMHSLASIFALYQDFGTNTSLPLFNSTNDFELFKMVDSVLTVKYPYTKSVMALNKSVVARKEQIEFNLNIGEKLMVGMPMPKFNLVDTDGDTVTFDTSKTQQIIYYVFAAWDKLQYNQVETINYLYGKYKNSGLRVVGISLDSSEEKLRAYLKANKVKFPVVCDYGYWESPFVAKLQIERVPLLILTNNQNIVVSNTITFNDIEAIILEQYEKLNTEK